MIKIKLDENLSVHLKQILNEIGFDTDTVNEEGLNGKPDTDVGSAAQDNNRILFSLDLDFADIRQFPPGEHAGIVVFRPNSFGPLTVNQFIIDFIKRTELAEFFGCLVIVEPTRIRVRRPD